jgi:hypothetical protein
MQRFILEAAQDLGHLMYADFESRTCRRIDQEILKEQGGVSNLHEACDPDDSLGCFEVAIELASINEHASHSSRYSDVDKVHNAARTAMAGIEITGYSARGRGL